MKTISRESHSAVRILPFRRYEDGTTTNNATGSGFLWRIGQSVFVVTCWHCLSGLHQHTRKPLGTFTPNYIRVIGRYCLTANEQGNDVSLQFSHEVPTEDAEGQYLWRQHPLKSAIDVCAIELNLTEDESNKFTCLNDLDLTHKFAARPATDAFIVGFPEGLSGQADTPIFKRATVASEPNLDFESEPVVLVDCIGNKGLSGAPVLLRGSGMLGDPNDFANALFGNWQNLLGVYSGRVSKEGIGSQLGRVWKRSCIDELFAT